MNIQTRYSFIYMSFVCILLICAIQARKNKKSISKYVSQLLFVAIFPIWANVLIMDSHNKLLSQIGYYLYYIGMAILMLSLVEFTNQYCQGITGIKVAKEKKQKPTIMYIFIIFDIVQLLANNIFHHAFTIKLTYVDDKIYYLSQPNIGLAIHSIILFVIYLCVLLIFFISIKTTTQIYREKYLVIFCTLILSGFSQAYFIFAQIPIDKSVLVHGVLCIIIYYFAIHYRPLRLLDRMLSNLASNLNNAIFMFDPMGHCIWANDKGYELFDINKIDEAKSKLIQTLGDITNLGDNWQKEAIITKNGSQRFLALEKQSIKTNKYLDGSFLIIKDNTIQRKEIEQKLYIANHDALTDLYNKQFLFNSIMDTFNDYPNRDYYIMYLDIKNFKIINDIFGKNTGDDTLIRMANWIRENMSNNCIYGRLVDDTFGILIPVEEFNKQQYERTLSNFVIQKNNIEHQVFVHIGVYQVTNKNIDVSVMFDRAHIALSNVNDKYVTCIKFYDDELRAKILEEQQIISNLHIALKENQIIPYLQPITDIDGKVVGAEALVRWIHPTKGFLSPISFIPIFENNGMIVEIDKHIWRRACEILSSWQGKYDDMFISINISPKDFYLIDVVTELKKLVEEYKIDIKKLRIEITETALIDEAKERTKIFKQLRDAGFIVEMDDFGSGYSSLNMLKDVIVDVLKIDMKFLANGNQRSKTIVKNVINMSKDLNMTTLTEGVETQYQFEQLVKMGCKLFQGYYFAKPMPLEDFEKFIQ